MLAAELDKKSGEHSNVTLVVVRQEREAVEKVESTPDTKPAVIRNGCG